MTTDRLVTAFADTAPPTGMVTTPAVTVTEATVAEPMEALSESDRVRSAARVAQAGFTPVSFTAVTMYWVVPAL